jgi:AraC-like DNA-binding protein
MLIDWQETKVRITLTGRSSWSRDLEIGWHQSIPDHDLWFVFQGSGRMRARSENAIPLTTGTCLWLSPGFVYEAIQDPKDPVGNYYVHFDLIDGSNRLRPYDRPKPPEHLDPVDRVVVDAVMRRVTELLPWFTPDISGRFPPEHIRIAESLMHGLLMDLDHASHGTARGLSGTRRHHNDVVMRAIAKIQDQNPVPCTIAELAEDAGYSSEHFSRVFRTVIGRPPEEFLIGARVQRAKELLTHSAMSIEDVSRLLGYSGQAFFSTQFRQRTGQSPREFRRNHQPSIGVDDTRSDGGK